MATSTATQANSPAKHALAALGVSGSKKISIADLMKARKDGKK